jgi:hypothetical protein
MNVPEYDLKNPSTWIVIREHDAASESELRRFSDSLVSIAGTNPHGEPNLKLVWGVTHQDPMTTDDLPKYYVSTPEPTLIGHQYREGDELRTVTKLEEVPAGKISLPIYGTTKLGERRFIVERWRSPEDLARSGRYLDSVRFDAETGAELLREFPRRGCYDFFLRLEDTNGNYHAPDAETLEAIRVKWKYDTETPFDQKQRDVQAFREREAEAEKRRVRGVYEERFSLGNLMKNGQNEETLCQQ